MEFHDAQKFVVRSFQEIVDKFQKVPGSAMLIRYIQSSYQDDPVRSAIELVLVIFFVRYLLSPRYATHTGNFVKLSEDEIDDLVDEWTPEPLVAPLTAFEKEEDAKLPVIVGFVFFAAIAGKGWLLIGIVVLRVRNPNSRTVGR